MLANPDYNNISIENYKWKILQIFMLALYVYATRPLTLVYTEVMANIQCQISTNEPLQLRNNNCLGILPRNILEYLDTHNRFVSDLYMDDIVNMLRQLHHLTLEKQFIEQKHDQNIRHLCQNYCVSTSYLKYILGKGKQPTFNFRYS